MSDFMYGVLAVSVAFNMYLIGRVLGMGKALRQIDNLLREVAANKVRVKQKPDGDWTMERVK